MTLRRKYFLYLFLLHALFVTVSWILLRDHGHWLFVLEACFVISAVIGWKLVHQLTEPLEFLRAGVEMMESADYTTRFREVRRPEVDRLIRLYNKMVDHLREERIQSQEQEHFLRRIMEISPAGMISLDLEGRIQETNPAAQRLLGGSESELKGSQLSETGESLGARLADLEDGETVLISVSGRRRIRCQRMAFMDRGFARPFYLLDELTHELYASEKAAYGKLIRIMSHEINNTSGAVISLLGSCLNYADDVREDHRDDFTQGLTVAMHRTQHMNDFMRGFAEVVRLPTPRRAPLRLSDLLKNIHRLMGPQLAERRIEWRWELDDQFPKVSLDASQMEQALLNIVKNAMEAIGEEGEIVVRTLRRRGARPRLEIEDSGGGIPPEVEERLFTSFYTNKKTGQGIGLTLVQEILLGHGFEYSLETVDRNRACFVVEM